MNDFKHTTHIGEMESLDDIIIEKKVLRLETLGEDCLFEVFDRLPTNYLYTVAETCTRFQDLASIQYRRRHPDKYVRISMTNENIMLLPNDHDVQIFGRKFLNVIVQGDGRNYRLENELLDFIVENCSSNLQTVRFEEAMLQADQLKTLNHMLHRAEILVLHKCGMTDDFYDCLLRHCHLLKHLILSDSYTFIDPTENKWLLKNYPALESVQLCSITMVSFQRELWETFFRQNPQIKSFSCDHWYSTNSRDRPVKIIAKNARNLTRLYMSLRGIGHLNGTYYDLHAICENKGFQRLELQFTGATGVQYLTRHSKIIGQMRLLHALHLTDMLITKETASIIALLTSLKQLNFVNTTVDIESAEYISKALTNLEEIYCDTAANDFTPFIRNSPALKKIELSKTTMDDLYLGVWGLFGLNDERSKIPDACPVTIYVSSTAIGGAETAHFASGIINIENITQDKKVLLKVKNTFINF